MATTSTRVWAMAMGSTAMLIVAAGCASGMGRGDKSAFTAFAKHATLPAVEAPVVSAPVVDGNMDGVYAKATPLSFVFLDGSAKAPKAKTLAYFVSSADTLFIFVKCDTATPDRLQKVSPEADIWHRDYVEVFVTPCADRAGAFAHFAASASGMVHTGKSSKDGEELVPTSRMKAGVKVTKTGWTAEFAIPFADLGVQPGKVNKVWVANIGRLAQAEGEDVAWCPIGQSESFGPAKFGFLWLDAGTVDNSK